MLAFRKIQCRPFLALVPLTKTTKTAGSARGLLSAFQRSLSGSSSRSSSRSRTKSGGANSTPTTSRNRKTAMRTATVEPAYVHPLSQIVLMHLQDQCHDWILDKQVDTLKLHRDGTFLLEFPDGEARIWTFYDPADKKHWLSYTKSHIQHRFLLQDNLLPAWHGNKRQSLPERIQKSVQELILAVDELEEED